MSYDEEDQYIYIGTWVAIPIIIGLLLLNILTNWTAINDLTKDSFDMFKIFLVFIISGIVTIIMIPYAIKHWENKKWKKYAYVLVILIGLGLCIGFFIYLFTLIPDFVILMLYLSITLSILVIFAIIVYIIERKKKRRF